MTDLVLGTAQIGQKYGITNNADTLGWQIGTNQLVADMNSKEITDLIDLEYSQLTSLRNAYPDTDNYAAGVSLAVPKFFISINTFYYLFDAYISSINSILFINDKPCFFNNNIIINRIKIYFLIHIFYYFLI